MVVNLENFWGAYLDRFHIKLCKTTIINFCNDTLASQVLCICKLTKTCHSLWVCSGEVSVLSSCQSQNYNLVNLLLIDPFLKLYLLRLKNIFVLKIYKDVGNYRGKAEGQGNLNIVQKKEVFFLLFSLWFPYYILPIKILYWHIVGENMETLWVF